MTDEEKYTTLDTEQCKWWVNNLFGMAKEKACNGHNFNDGEEIQSAQDKIIKILEIVEEFERAQIITGGRLNGRTYAYKCGLEDGKRKALEQPTSEDCVSRQAVLDMATTIQTDDYSGNEILDVVDVEDVKALPPVTPTQKWIPVSEDLPKENGWYQCTVILNDLPRTMELFYKNGKWLDNRRINMFDTYDIYGYGNTKEKHKLSYQELISEFEWNQVVIAWQPLPQPYEEKRGNE